MYPGRVPLDVPVSCGPSCTTSCTCVLCPCTSSPAAPLHYRSSGYGGWVSQAPGGEEIVRVASEGRGTLFAVGVWEVKPDCLHSHPTPTRPSPLSPSPHHSLPPLTPGPHHSHWAQATLSQPSPLSPSHHSHPTLITLPALIAQLSPLPHHSHPALTTLSHLSHLALTTLT